MKLKIVTFNLRCVYKGDGINAFINRLGLITEKIVSEVPDVIAFQEGVPSHVPLLRRALPEYTFVFNQRNADLGGEGLLLAYKNGLELFQLECFWLSETPYVPGSRYTHQSDCPRVCQAALIKAPDGKLFRVYNVHLDHVDDEARCLGIAQVLEYMAQQDKKIAAPAFLLGDFNATPDSGVIALCDNNTAYPLCDLTKDSGGTFHDFGRREPVKIDYIYADTKTAQGLQEMSRWEDAVNGVFLSDHYPVYVEVVV